MKVISHLSNSVKTLTHLQPTQSNNDSNTTASVSKLAEVLPVTKPDITQEVKIPTSTLIDMDKHEGHINELPSTWDELVTCKNQLKMNVGTIHLFKPFTIGFVDEDTQNLMTPLEEIYKNREAASQLVYKKMFTVAMETQDDRIKLERLAIVINENGVCLQEALAILDYLKSNISLDDEMKVLKTFILYVTILDVKSPDIITRAKGEFKRSELPIPDPDQIDDTSRYLEGTLKEDDLDFTIEDKQGCIIL